MGRIQWHSIFYTHLEGAEAQFKENLVLGGDANGECSEHHVMDPKQWDQQQRRLGQPPARDGSSAEHTCLPAWLPPNNTGPTSE